MFLDRGRESRSQIVYTTARGREVVFWQSPRTRKQARPNVATPTARAAGLPDLTIIVDSHERYPYRFADKPVTVVRKALACGDYGIEHDGRLAASVERKSLADLVASISGGKLKFAIAGLAALPRAGLVVEDRYSQIFALTQIRPAVVADGIAELQVRYPNVPIVFCETRKLAEEWTYRYLAAAHIWRDQAPSPPAETPTRNNAESSGEPSTAEVRAWARDAGLDVPDRGRLRPEIIQAWHQAHQR